MKYGPAIERIDYRDSTKESDMRAFSDIALSLIEGVEGMRFVVATSPFLEAMVKLDRESA